MNFILALSLLLVGGIPPTILASYRCLTYPVRYLDSGCSVRNLTVRDNHNNLIVDDLSCGTGVNRQSFSMDWPYFINFTHPVMPQFQYSSFLLIVIDNTSKQLLWMVANITVPRYEKRLTPLSGFYSKPVTIKPYEVPLFNSTHREHHIEFLVFQQTLNFPPYANYMYMAPQMFYPFNLLQWLDSQITSGALLCGPVAGAMVRMYDNTYHPPAYPATHPPPYPNSQPNHPHPIPNKPLSPSQHGSQHRNSAFRFNSNICLLSVIVGMIFFWYLRK